MIFGVTYAVYASIVVSSILLLNPPITKEQNDEKSSLFFSYGFNDPRKNTVGNNGFISAELYSGKKLFWNLKPLYALGVSVDGGGYLTVGLRNELKLGPLRIIPFFGPALYQRQVFHGNIKQLPQFRTGFSLMLPYQKLMVGAGFYHISNAYMTGLHNSAGLDITYFSLKYNF